jgi:hypothetical protein
MALTHNDNGFKSRKWLGFLLVVVALIVAGKVLAIAALATVAPSIVGAYGLFVGARVAADHVASKAGAKVEPPPT